MKQLQLPFEEKPMRKIHSAPQPSENFSQEELNIAIQKIESRFYDLERWEAALIKTLEDYEKDILSVIEAQFTTGGCNDRWLAVGRTHIQQGFMAIIRAIVKPESDESNVRTPQVKVDPPGLVLGAAIRDEGLLGEDEGNY